MTDPVYCGDFASVFKGDYLGHSVAVKVVQLYQNDRDATLRVGIFIKSDSHSHWRRC